MAVAERASEHFQARLLAALEEHRERHDTILEMNGEFFGSEGTARLLAWLVLSDRLPVSQGAAKDRPLRRLIELVHTQRVTAHPIRAIDPADTRFRSLLIAFALLGETLFGDLIRQAAGAPNGPTAGRDFRRRLVALLNEAS